MAILGLVSQVGGLMGVWIEDCRIVWGERGSIATFMASALWLIMVVLVKHSLLDVCKRKAAFFWLLSIKKNLFFGRAIASGIPGKPPPLPRSTMLFVR